MNPGRYQLYAFEFFVAHLKTSHDLVNLRVEVSLFNAPYAVIKPKMSLSQSMMVMKSHFVVDPDNETKEMEEEREPFTLDLRSNSFIGDAEEVEPEDDIQDDKLMDDAVKMASFDPCAKDGPKRVSLASDDYSPKDPDTAAEPPHRDSVKLEDSRSQLRMFPEDPTGMPYNKVKKGAKPTRRSSLGKIETQQGSEEPEVQLFEGEKYTVVEKKLREAENEPEQKREPGVRVSISEAAKSKHLKSRMEPNAEPSDIFESGVTIILPMEPLAMLHNLQRVPLHVRVCNDDNRFCAEAFLDLWPLFECVLRAERGPPTPVTSSCEMSLRVKGNFEAVICSMVRLFAFGNFAVRPIKSNDENPNEEMSYSKTPARAPFERFSKDIREGLPIVSSPEHTPREQPRMYTQEEEEEILAKKEEDSDYFARNIAYCPIHRIVTPQPKDNYETIRWKIDKMLGLTEVTIQEYEAADDEKANKSSEDEEVANELELWRKEKKKELRMKSKKASQTRAKTRTILQKILTGMEKPDPIRSKPDIIEDNKGEEVEDEDKPPIADKQPETQLTDEEMRAKNAKFLFDEIRRQQEEERMIKHYKRVFRMMIRVLESERGVSTSEQRKRQKQRRRMQDLLMELETYSAEDVEMAYVKVSKEKMKVVKRKQWDVDYWPSVPEEEPEGEEMEEEAEDEETRMKNTDEQPDASESQASNKEEDDNPSQDLEDLN